jgi:hypothetical protein
LSQGGALFLAYTASVFLVNATVEGNVAERTDVAEGGACYLEDGSSLAVLDSRLCNNSALDGAKQSYGGAISCSGQVTVELVGSRLLDNAASAKGLGASAFGGAVYARTAPSTITVVSCSLRRNVALSRLGPAKGGAFYAGRMVTVNISNGEWYENRAEGATAEGGGMWFGGDRLAMSGLSVANSNCSASGADGRANGGALFQAGLSAELVDCRLIGNTAGFAYPAVHASGGAVYADFGVALRLLDCVLRHNSAGCLDPLSVSQDYDHDKSRAKMAMHIYSQGRTTLDGCAITDDLGQYAFTPWQNSAWFWIVSDGGILEFRDSRFGTTARYVFDPCTFSSNHVCDTDEDGSCSDGGDYDDCGKEPPAEAGPYGRLLNVASTLAQVVVRGCIATNVTLHSTVGPNLGQILVLPIGIVNSTFEPPLDSSLDSSLGSSLVQPDLDHHCATVVAGAALCDPRATCERRPSGGLQCSCIAEGVHDKPGTLPDGQQCEQRTSIAMLLQSQAASITVRKPSNGSANMQIMLRATGESRVSVAFSASTVRRSATVSDGMQPNSSRTWTRLDEAQLSLDGHHVIWSTLPPANSEIALDARAKQYAVTKEFAFQFGIDCRGEAACVADGDTVEMVVEVGSESGAGGARSAVRITTLVQSFLSCPHTRAFVEPDVERVPISTPFRVQLFANDIDNMNVSFTMANISISLVFGGRALSASFTTALPVQWSRGSSQYLGYVPAELTSQPGRYDLVVSASNAWNGTELSSCELLRRTIIVEEGLGTTWILAGAVGSAVLVVGGLVIFVRKKHAHLQAIMVMLFTEVHVL